MEIPARLPPPPLPRSSAAGWWIVFVLLAALQLAANSPVLREYDEGLILAGAAQVAHGAVPYRDFWSMYGPGSFYALAGLDRVFGESVLVGRGFDALARAAIVLLVFALARRRAGVACAAAAAAFAFAWLVGVRDYLFPALPATALALLAVQACARVLARGAQAPTWAWAGPGAAVGLALLFRHDFGVYAGIACLPPLLGAAGGSAARRIAAFAAGALLAASPLVAVLWWQAPLHDLVDDLVRLPLAVYVQNRALPFLAPHELVAELVSARSLADVMALGACLPLGIAAVSVPMALWRRVRPRGMRGGEALVSDALIVLNALLCVKGSVRFEMLHMLPATMVSAALLARFLGEPRPRWLRRAAAAAVGLGLAGGGAALAGSKLSAELHAGPGRTPVALMLLDWPACARAAPARLGCFVIDDDRLAVLAFLRAQAHAGDRLYVGTGRHDKLYVNNVELYFLSGLTPATKWQDLHPGVQTTRAVQLQMIEEMTQNPPAFVVLNTMWDAREEPNRSRFSSGVTLLDDHLRAGYAVRLRSGPYSVLMPREPVLRTAARPPGEADAGPR